MQGSEEAEELIQKEVQGKYDEAGPRQWPPALPGGSEATPDGREGLRPWEEPEAGSQHHGQRQGRVSVTTSGLSWLGSRDHGGV